MRKLATDTVVTPVSVRTPSMTVSTVSIPIRTGLFVELVDFLRDKGSDRDPIKAVEDALEYWISNAEWKTEILLPEVLEKKNFQGYRWKTLLLPPGTRIRMTYKGETYHAEVSGDDFIYDGNKTTPSEFAITIASGTSRNAWRDLWVKRPRDKDFRLADDLRRSSERDA